MVWIKQGPVWRCLVTIATNAPTPTAAPHGAINTTITSSTYYVKKDYDKKIRETKTGRRRKRAHILHKMIMMSIYAPLTSNLSTSLNLSPYVRLSAPSFSASILRGVTALPFPADLSTN